MSKRNPSRGGFTVIELMLVVGILGIIATIAIPAFIRFQLRTKASEVKANLAAVRVAEEAYHAEFNLYVSATPVPASVNSSKRSWPLTAGTSHGFNTLGWVPDGTVYYQYAATTNGGTAFTAAARSDIDNDGNFNTWGYVRPVAGTSIGVVGPFGTCEASGAFNELTQTDDLLREVGPCDRFSGKTIF